MATSNYFNNYNAKYNEQRLMEELITESIKIMGFDAYYLPNNNDAARDLIYGEDPIKKFQSAFPLEMYLSNASDYNGDREMFSKFGELYEIKFTNQNKDFFMLGRKVPYYYELELEKFKYSQEVISTGVADIDQVVTDSAYTLHLNTGVGVGVYQLQELVFQAEDNTYDNATAIGTVQSWIPSSNTLSITNIAGEFYDEMLIIGQSSNAQFMLQTFDPLNDPANKESYDNEAIQTSASGVVNNSEVNPIGGL